MILHVLIGSVLFFALPGPVTASPLCQLTGFVHLGYFSLLAWWLAGRPFLTNRPPSHQILIIMTMMLMAGGIIELLQPYFGRNASWSDLGIDLVGGLIGLLFLAPGTRRLPRGLLAGSRLAALALAVLVSAGPVANLWDMGQAALSFPILGNFETLLENRRWTRGAIDHHLARQGGACLRVALGTKKYAGTSLKRSLGNWQGYETFAFSLYNPSPEPLRITVSIRDQEHFQRDGSYDDRFNRSFHLSQGWNDLHIPVREIETAPVGRVLDLARIREVAIFTVALPEPRVIYLDHVRLIP